MGCCSNKEDTKFNYLFSPKYTEKDNEQSEDKSENTHYRSRSNNNKQNTMKETGLNEKILNIRKSNNNFHCKYQNNNFTNATKVLGKLHDHENNNKNLIKKSTIPINLAEKNNNFTFKSILVKKQNSQESNIPCEKLQKNEQIKLVTEEKYKNWNDENKIDNSPNFGYGSIIKQKKNDQYVSDNNSLIIEKENFQNFFQNSNQIADMETLNKAYDNINNFEISNDNISLNSSYDSYNISIEKKLNNNIRNVNFDLNKNRARISKVLNEKSSNNIKPIVKSSFHKESRNRFLTENDLANNNRNSLEDNKITYSSNNKINFQTNLEKLETLSNYISHNLNDNHHKIISPCSKSPVTKFSLDKYEHVFGDVFKKDIKSKLRSNVQLQKLSLDLGGDMTFMASSVRRNSNNITTIENNLSQN